VTAAIVQRFTDRPIDIVVRIFVSQAAAHFTVGELHALVRFYSSSDGQGVMSKLLAFTRDLEAEVVAAITPRSGPRWRRSELRCPGKRFIRWPDYFLSTTTLSRPSSVFSPSPPPRRTPYIRVPATVRLVANRPV
jgi:hypothetical protein